MSRLEIRLLGGFQVVRPGAEEPRLESQRVRGLLAYLACHPGQAFSRDRLGGLLWPDDEPDAARRNLRQALYNLRQNVSTGGGESPIVTSHQSIALAEQTGLWIDVAAFEGCVERAREAGVDAVQLEELSCASELYRGDLLAGFYLRGGSAEFEEWLVTEQERLRDLAVGVLRTLIEYWSARGRYRAAIREARRLVEMDPLSEETHRTLMRLYYVSGRRSRALAQFEELAALLERELGVEPLDETRQLYESILREQIVPEADDEQPVGPVVPLVGRAEELAALRASWQKVLAGGARLALVEGESGLGKTRLAKTFVHQATAQRRTRVLQARCYGGGHPQIYQPFVQLAREALAEEQDREEGAARVAEMLERLEEGRDLRSLILDLIEHVLRPEAAAGSSPQPEVGSHEPLILVLDDLHRAGPAALALLVELLERFADEPLWVLATTGGAAGPRRGPLAEIEHQIDRISPRRLELDAVVEVANALVADERAVVLTDFLAQGARGEPLRLAELLNLLCDEGRLAAGRDRRWFLRSDPIDLLGPDLDELDALVMRRVVRLPTSARRLLTLAAVIGESFDVELLTEAASEHMGVIEIGLELMLERWLIRQSPGPWSPAPRERDLVVWAHGVRRGRFEFAHRRIREAVYEDLNPLRRQVLHRQVAAAYEDRPSQVWGAVGTAEVIAHHYLAGGEPERALPHLETAAAAADRLGAGEAAEQLRHRAEMVRVHLAAGSGRTFRFPVTPGDAGP